MDASRALRYAGKPTEDVLAALNNALRDKDDYVSHEAAIALSHQGPRAINLLIGALRDQQVAVRRRAAEALGSAGAEGRDAVQPLINALKDEDPVVRSFAAMSLQEIDPVAAKNAGVP